MVRDEQEVSNSLKLLVKSSFVVLVFVILSKLLTYLYKIIIARDFGPSEYGLFTLALIISAAFISFASLGLSEGLVRYISLYKNKDMKKVKYLWNLSFYINVISSLAAGAVLFIFAEVISVNFFHDANLTIYLKVFSFTIPFALIGGIYLAILRSFEKIYLYSFINNVFQNGLRVVILIILVLLGFGRESIYSSYLIGALGFFVVTYIFVRSNLAKILNSGKLKKGRKELRKSFLSYSWPIVFLVIIGGVFYWVDSLVIGYFMSSSDLGFYGVAFTIISLFGIAPELFMQLFLPMVIREYSNKKLDVVKEVSKQVTKWIFVLNLPLFVLIFAFPGAIINILFGEAFLAGEGALKILSFGGIVSSIFLALFTNLLSMKGKSKLILINVVSISILNLILNIILVPRYGIVGAAFATSFVWILLTFVLFFEVKSILSLVPLKKEMIKISLVMILPSLLLYFLRAHIPKTFVSLFVLSLLFFLSYIFLIVITGCLDKNDLMIWRTFKGRFLKNGNKENTNLS